MKTLSIVALFLLITLQLKSEIPLKRHTIYIAGPTALGNPNWQRESKILYKILKREAISKGNTIEFFPKKTYRETINQEVTQRKKPKGNIPSKKSLNSSYENIQKLYDDLLELILVRLEEISDINEDLEVPTFEDKVHIKAYGRGGELLRRLIYGSHLEGYSEVLGSLVVFDGDKELETSSDTVDSESCHTIINITINGDRDSSEESMDIGSNCCTPRMFMTKKFLNTAAAAIALAAAIIALL